MKTRLTLLASSVIALVSLNALRAEDAPQAPVPVTLVPAPQQVEAPKPDNQRLYGPSGATIIPAEQARALIEKFKDAYAKLGNPRMLFFINRDLVDSSSGLKLSGHTEKYEETNSNTKSDVEKMTNTVSPVSPQTQVNVTVGDTSGSASHLPKGKAEIQKQNTKTSGENSYTLKDSAKPTLADRQTAREVERLFGRAFRAAGASLADQKVASDMLSDVPHGNLSGLNDQAAKDREALGTVADVVVEILVSSRAITVPAVSGDQQMLMPDIQATAIRLKDAAILGQAASSDILGKDRYAGRILQQFEVRDITEATALALMEDMASSAK
jgi:hypothetical protein